jgi:hypothetical protein
MAIQAFKTQPRPVKIIGAASKINNVVIPEPILLLSHFAPTALQNISFRLGWYC